MISLLIKPASGQCQMKCKYCFYSNEMENRNVANYGIMNMSTAKNLINCALNKANRHVTFAFQGGEPTLAGLDFFVDFVKYVNKQNVKKINIAYAIQTNGYNIDKAWASFFAKNNFLVGLSLDGTEAIHNEFRLDRANKGTFNKVMSVINLLKSYKVEFNILTVVTKEIAYNIEDVYKFYKEQDLVYQQYIPCIDGYNEEKQPWSLDAESFTLFLRRLFDLWHRDMISGKYVYNRMFENWCGILAGIQPEACGFLGRCGVQYVVEADGSVYPCDFFVLDDFNLGNINLHSFHQIDSSPKRREFLKQSLKVEEDCKKCEVGYLCRGGCRRDREIVLGEISKNKFCQSYQEFLTYAQDKMFEINKLWLKK